MRESDIEAYLRDQVRALGGKAYKFVSPGNAGVPDRLVCFPGGRAVFAELKAPGGKLIALQQARCRELARLGHTVIVLDSKSAVDDFVEGLSQ